MRTRPEQLREYLQQRYAKLNIAITNATHRQSLVDESELRQSLVDESELVASFIRWMDEAGLGR